VATDCLSAFDAVLPIPVQGRVLAARSRFWFQRPRHIVVNHLTAQDPLALGRRRTGARRSSPAGL